MVLRQFTAEVHKLAEIMAQRYGERALEAIQIIESRTEFKKRKRAKNTLQMARNTTARAESTVTLNGKAAESALEGLKIKAKQYRDAILEASRAGRYGKGGEAEQSPKGN